MVAPGETAPDRPSASEYGALGRMGLGMADHARLVFAVWLVLVAGFGYLVPKLPAALSGYGWPPVDAESVQARDLIGDHFNGRNAAAFTIVVHAQGKTVDDQAFQQTLQRVRRFLLDHPRDIASVQMPGPRSISRDRHTAVVIGGAARDANGMVQAAKHLNEDLADLGEDGVNVDLTGLSGIWADFNEASEQAMVKSELISWPVVLAVLVVAFGSVVGGLLPLPMALLGMGMSGGVLYIAAKIFDVSVWAMNFALMFSLALGIDYTLYVTMRFRQALAEQDGDARQAMAQTMDTAGKAILLAGVTVIVSLLGVLFLPSLAFRTMSFGIAVSVVFILATALTLLPILLFKLGHRVDKLRLPGLSTQPRSDRTAGWAERIWRRPWLIGLAGLAMLLGLSVPLLHVDTRPPSLETIPRGEPSREGYMQLARSQGMAAPATLQIIAPRDRRADVLAALRSTGGQIQTLVPQTSESLLLVDAVPRGRVPGRQIQKTVHQLRDRLPEGALVGGYAAEAVDLEDTVDSYTWVVLPVVLTMGALILLVAFRSIVLAIATVLTNLLATAAAFGFGTLMFQDGFLAGLFGVEPQGFLDVWVPVFFFALIFGLAMDYSVFLLSAAREEWEQTGDPRTTLIEGMARSGRTIFAAGAVMFAVFLTFAIASDVLAPIEMAVILGVAVAIEAILVRLTIMPAIIRIAGHKAWWLPDWLDRRLPVIRWSG